MREYILGSFNMCKFSKQSGPETKKSYETIAKIIRDSRFDIIAMQEVFNKEAVRELVLVLNEITGCEWDFSWDEPKKTINKQAREGYAFVWNKRRLDKVSTRLDNGKIRTFEPRIVNQYRKSIIRLGKKELIRNPYYGRFAPKNNYGESYGFELRIINAHIMYSSSVDDEDGYDISDINKRKNEYALLSQVILPKVDLKVYGLYEEDNNGVKTHLNAYTVLMGDYNLSIKNGKNLYPHLPDESYLSKGFIAYVPKGSDIISVQDEETTFKRVLKDPEESIYHNNYDHFTFDEVKFNQYKVGWEAHRINAVEHNPIGVNISVGDDFDGDYKKYIEKVSDHLPVMMRLEI